MLMLMIMLWDIFLGRSSRFVGIWFVGGLMGWLILIVVVFEELFVVLRVVSLKKLSVIRVSVICVDDVYMSRLCFSWLFRVLILW